MRKHCCVGGGEKSLLCSSAFDGGRTDRQISARDLLFVGEASGSHRKDFETVPTNFYTGETAHMTIQNLRYSRFGRTMCRSSTPQTNQFHSATFRCQARNLAKPLEIKQEFRVYKRLCSMSIWRRNNLLLQKEPFLSIWVDMLTGLSIHNRLC